MIKGSCLCGQVRYEISGHLGKIVHCHCTTCRKAHGAAFSTVAAAQIADFTFTSGEDLLNSYESSSGKNRYFCSRCGSQIYAHRGDNKHYILRLGTLDGNPLAQPEHHIWVSEKASWYDIENNCKLPQSEKS